MFIEGLSFEARHAAQAERRSANTATGTASAAAAAAAERASSASPPFFALSPPTEMDSIASPPTPASADGPTPAIAGSLAPLVYAEDFIEWGRWWGGGAVVGGGAVARWRGDDDVRVLASARCCRRRGEDATINIRWEVGGGHVTKGGFEVVAVRGGSRCHRTAVHCASADHCDHDAGLCRSATRWRLRQ